MWIKICGTTNLEDALLAVDAGADAIGFVFAESPRRVEPDAVKRIVAALPASLEKVGVFVDEKPARVAEIAEETGLTTVQLHGARPYMVVPRETPRGRLLVTTVVAAAESFFVARAERNIVIHSFDRMLVDSSATRGGSGNTFDWRKLQPIMPTLRLPVIVAGGLTPQNVAEAISILRPWGVDVVSGVEHTPGRKDPYKVRAFVAAAREAGSKL
jgi:phosphoribosylanthranilate isomerase